jgi:hypothetical protein
MPKKPGFWAIKSVAATGEKPGFLHNDLGLSSIAGAAPT